MVIVNNKNFFSFILIILFFVFLIFLISKKEIPFKDFFKQNTISLSEEKQYIFFDDVKVEVEIADNIKTRAKGLSGRVELKDGFGMLFIFENIGKYNFWMKDMNFPIDIIWMGEDMKVIFIKENALPESYPETFGPEEYTKYVLEVPSFFAKRNNIKIGDTMQFVK